MFPVESSLNVILNSIRGVASQVVKMETDIIYNEDCLQGLSKIPNKSIDLIVIDPPYFQVMKSDWKGNKYEWDNQWDTLKDYLIWIIKVAEELKRILKDNGSFYIFADDKICAYIQVELDKMFKLENSITWVKPNNLTIKGWTQYRSYAPITEKILFYSNEWDIKSGQLIYDKILDEHLKPNNNFAKYLREEFKRAGVTRKEIAKLFPSKTGGLTGCVSNWLNGDNIITQEQYEKVRDYLNRDLKQDYEDLKQDYEYLKQDYEDLRRYFNPKQNFTDVWTFNIMGGKESVNHPTQKPIALIKRIIETSSKEGQIVLDCFMGSGTTALACKELNRRYIGFEKDPEYCKIISKRLSQQTLSNLSATPRTLPNGNPNGEFNINLKTTPSASSKLPTATSLNNNIIRNSDTSLAGLVQLNSGKLK
jgi:site-specific DNA-methyltransferase (adenine-specific)